MNTITQTHTRTDIRKVFECFGADLKMLAYRTQAMSLDCADNCAHDILIMAEEDCLQNVHIQLLDSGGSLIRVHKYQVEKNISWDSQRPGANRWPCSPSGNLNVIIYLSDNKKADKLKQSGRLKINWGPSSASTDYSHMRGSHGKMYASNSYGLRRNSFTI